MLNVVVLQGRLGSNPELRSTRDQVSVATVSIAVNRDGKDAGTDWIDIVAWRGTAELLCKYWSKGDEILVTGRLQIREYQDRDGNKRKATEVVASKINFCGSKKSKNEDGEDGFEPADNLDDSGLPFN